MQKTKDSLYVALRDRLAALDPARVVFLDGASRPAVVVAENGPVTAAPPLADAFYLSFGAAAPMALAARSPVLRLDAVIQYRTAGTAEQLGVDRGRSLAALDLELASVLSPHFTAKRDYTQSPPADLASMITWSTPEFAAAESADGELRRTVRLAVFFRPEVELP